MNYKLLLAFVLVLGALSCSSDTELHKVMDENGNLVEEYTRSIKDYKKQGEYKKYYEGGNAVMEIAQFENDTMEGEFIRFAENGDTLSVAMMKGGKYHGYFKQYYDTGNNLMQFYQNENNKMAGPFKEYYKSGALKGVLSFKDNLEDGPFVEYHENGNKSFEGIYVAGKENGELLKYNEAGELIRKMDCQMARCTTTWKMEGIED